MDADPGNRDDLFTMLETVEIVTASNPTGTVLWMHGLGADGHDFEPVVPELVERGERGLRFVFPHAPVRPVTWNAGYRMRAWYDILSLERGAAQDEAGTRESAAAIAELIAREGERGIAPERIAVAGFSQGGALALYFGTRFTQRLAGIAGLSCYLPLADRLDAERAAANQATPIFLAHGSYDPVVDYAYGEETRALLGAAGYAVEWHSYPMPHSVSPQEIADIAAWLRRVLP
jgi:phospholipase/carboxylesterase